MTEDRYLSVTELQQFLGGVSRTTINKWLDEGRWPYLQPSGPGGVRKVRLSEVVGSEKRGLLA